MAAAMRFFSDNAAAACPEVLAAIAEANRLDTAYDGDAWSQRLERGLFRRCSRREVEALWVSTGTAANASRSPRSARRTAAIVCHRDAHIQIDECGAPEFYTGGAKLLLGEGEGAKLTPDAVDRAARRRVRDDVHQVQPAALSITNATEYGLRLHARGDGGARRAVPGARASASTSTAPASPMRWRASAARRPT